MFKVGDKVRIIDSGDTGASVEDIGVIEHIDDDDLPYKVRIDLRNDYWYFRRNQIEHIENIIKNKNDLKVGDIVTLKNGDRLLVHTDEEFLDMLDKNYNSICDFDDINDDLTYVGDNRDYDIIKVERPFEYETVYKTENKVREMTVDEISKALGYEVKIVKEEK